MSKSENENNAADGSVESSDLFGEAVSRAQSPQPGDRYESASKHEAATIRGVRDDMVIWDHEYMDDIPRANFVIAQPIPLDRWRHMARAMIKRGHTFIPSNVEVSHGHHNNQQRNDNE
jgi:hypothetical protein